MKAWKHKIQLDARDLSPDIVAAELAAKLRTLPEDFLVLEASGTSLVEIIEWLGEAAKSQAEYGAVDDILRELYDWADRHSLWVNLRTV